MSKIQNNNQNNKDLDKKDLDKTNLDKNIEKLNKQIETQMKKAFYDLIIEKTACETPDFDWLIKLYSEIREGLISILKQGSDLRKEMEECFDIELFSQMIKNNAFGGEDMIKLINYTFNKLLQLGSPGRDKIYRERQEEILKHMYTDKATFGSIVGIYLKNSHLCLDELHLDIANIKKNLSNLNKK